MEIVFEPPKNNRRKRKKWFLNFLIIGTAAISFIFGYKALSNYLDQQQGYKESKAIYNDIENFVFDMSSAVTKADKEQTSESIDESLSYKQFFNFNKLKTVNQMAYGWIIVKGTNINYPVTYADDNEYWLTHAFDGQNSANGCIFVDFRCKDNPQNTVIYGHRMQDGSMFYELDHLESEQYYKENNCQVEILREDGTYIYEIYAVALVDADGDVYRVEFSENFTLDDYLSYIKSKAIYTTKYLDNIKSDSLLLTLSTCQSISKVPVRRVVCCVLTEIIQ